MAELTFMQNLSMRRVFRLDRSHTLLGQTEPVLLFLLQDCLQFGKWPVAQCGNRWRVHSVSEAETEPNDSEWKQHSDIVNYSNKDVKLQLSNSFSDNVQDKDAVPWIISKCDGASLIKHDLVT